MNELITKIPNGNREIVTTFVTPEGDGPFPVILMNHGFAGSRNEGSGFTRIANALAQKGFATVRMDFAGCGDSKEEFTEFNDSNNLSDSIKALNWALETENIVREKIGILGFSNGGKLSLLLTRENSPFKCMALIAPASFPGTGEIVADTKAKLEIAKRDGFNVVPWFGSEINVGSKYYQELLDSYPLLANVKVNIPTVVIYGDADVTVPKDVSLGVADMLKSEVVVIPKADHGFGLYKNQSVVSNPLEESITNFFVKNL